MPSAKTIKPIYLLLFVSIVIRSLLAGWIELGTDEAYYWTYAAYPDWSHYDHPGMVGWVIQLFSLNLLLDSEFFLRLASIVFMTFNTWIIYRIGTELKDERTGFYAALLYTGSIYAFIITGIFILPDTPLILFWLLAFWMLVKFLRQNRNMHLLLAGLFIGLGILSKYTGAFLWAGFLLYLLCFDRKQFKKPALYLSLLITAACCLPILYWNMENDFISFRFHSERVGLLGAINFGSFLTEIAGEFFYNNPVIFVVSVLTLISAFRKRILVDDRIRQLTLLTALPMIGLFLLFSLTRPTLPHWSAPAYVLLIPLCACWMSTLSDKRIKNVITASLAVLALILIVGVTEIKTGIIPLDDNTEATRIGHDDITLDLYGWRQAGAKFADLRAQAIANNEMAVDADIIGNNWFPTASIDYYLAQPLGIATLGYGPLEKIHKYQWINEQRGGFTKGKDYWYLADSHYFIDPLKVYAYTNFKDIKLAGIIPIERNGKIVRNIFVYECKSLVYGPPTLGEIRDKKNSNK